jgi:hypothetical protein
MVAFATVPSVIMGRYGILFKKPTFGCQSVCGQQCVFQRRRTVETERPLACMARRLKEAVASMPHANAERLTRQDAKILDLLARRKGFEPLTPRFEVWGYPISNQS